MAFHRLSSCTGAPYRVPATNAWGIAVPPDGIYTERHTHIRLSAAGIRASLGSILVPSPTTACWRELLAEVGKRGPRPCDIECVGVDY
ncbi:hypothetical protein NL676_030458 [Syzygium grande]|nr:hypothetical protein NL676_030458 [Syzygium grande]